MVCIKRRVCSEDRAPSRKPIASVALCMKIGGNNCGSQKKKRQQQRLMRRGLTKATTVQLYADLRRVFQDSPLTLALASSHTQTQQWEKSTGSDRHNNSLSLSAFQDGEWMWTWQIGRGIYAAVLEHTTSSLSLSPSSSKIAQRASKTLFYSEGLCLGAVEEAKIDIITGWCEFRSVDANDVSYEWLVDVQGAGCKQARDSLDEVLWRKDARDHQTCIYILIIRDRFFLYVEHAQSDHHQHIHTDQVDILTWFSQTKICVSTCSNYWYTDCWNSCSKWWIAEAPAPAIDEL